MVKPIVTTLRNFSEGITNDIRSTSLGVARFNKGFDLASYPNKLMPYRSNESGQDTITRKISDFVYVNGRVYGLGGPSNVATMFYKNDFGDGTWLTTANNASDIAENKGSNAFLIYYAKTALIYGVSGTSTVFAYDPAGLIAWADQTVGSNPSCALVHSKDDIMYVAYYHSTAGARIASNNNGSWTIPALTIGLRYKITSMCEYGNYLAIACKQATDTFQGPSRVFLWDRDSSVTTLDESIDFGLGDIKFLEEYEGKLIGISFLDDVQSNGALSQRLIFREYSGGSGSTEFMKLIGTDPGANTTGIFNGKYKANNKLYFSAGLVVDTVLQNGIWTLTKTSTNRLALSLDFLPNNDTAVATIEGFILAGSYMFIAYNNDGSISKTDNTANFNQTAILETVKYDLGDSSVKKGLVGVTVMTTPLPLDSVQAQVVLKYKRDSESSWTTIFTHAIQNSISHSAINIESSGAALGEYKEVQFRIESTKNAEITGLKFSSEVLDKDLYQNGRTN